MTEEEKIVWEEIRRDKLGVRFRRQYGIGPYIADFYCPEKKLVVEIDGGHHYTEEGLAYDKEREEYMAQYGIKTIRFSNREVREDIKGVIDRIDSFLVGVFS